MKLNFGLLGIALAQSGDDYSDERHDYSYDYNVGNHHTNHYSGFNGDQSYTFNDHGAKYVTGDFTVQAQRLSCWNSNSLRDMNHDGKFSTHTTDMRHHYHHQYGFENAYYGEDGSSSSIALADFGDSVNGRDIDVSKDDHSVNAIKPNKWGYQSDNPDAKYHYGHHVNDADLVTNKNRPHSGQIANNEDSFHGVVDDWRYSLRHAGCLYESPDYYYGANTFNSLRYLTYSQDSKTTNVSDGAGSALAEEITTAAAEEKVTAVHWVHVFNAHLHIDGTTYCSATANHADTGAKCINGDKIHQFAVVMANPTYEGLGFINFVATYHDLFTPTDGTSVTGYPGHRFRSNYAKSALYENSGYWHLSKTGQQSGSPTWSLDCSITSALDCDTASWMNENAGGTQTNHRGLAISSFPHNQLGKDFRFNIRTLHQMGDGYQRAELRETGSSETAYSYFFYAISSIQITFPEYVGHVNDCWRQRNSGACTKDMVHQIIVDQSAVQMVSDSPQNRAGDIAYGNFQLRAVLTNSDGRCDTTTRTNIESGTFATGNNCASWCFDGTGIIMNGNSPNLQTDDFKLTDSTGNSNNMCGDTLTIKGMHRTYDELHLRQFGTIQEIWVQLQYAYSHPTSYTTGATPVGFESPFPNVFFSAPQVLTVSGECDDAVYDKCNGYTRAENVPYAGSDFDAKRWNENVDGLGSHRGDAFWPDDLDA